MPFNYAASARTALRLLAQFGQTVTLSRIVPGTYDPAAGETTPDTPQAQTATAALLDYNLIASGQQFADGSMIRIGDKRLLIAAEGLAWAPDEMTTVTDNGGTVWQLEKLTALAPAGIPVLYKANATK